MVAVVQELIGIAKDIRAALQRNEKEEPTRQEIAFCNASAQNESAAEVRSNDHLRVIALDLPSDLKSNAFVGWQHRVSVCARMRVLAKRAKSDDT